MHSVVTFIFICLSPGSNAFYKSLIAMNYPWRPAAARNIYADSAASNSSLPIDRPSNNLPIAVGTVASRILLLQKLAGNQKHKPPPKTPSRFPQTRSTPKIRRERSNTSSHRSRSPLQLRPPLNRRRENSRSSFGRRPTNIFGNPASRNSQPNEQPQTGTNHSFLGLQTPRSNHDEGHARAGYKGTPRVDACIGPLPSSLRGIVQETVSTSGWTPITEPSKTSSKSQDQKTAGRKVDIHRGIQRLEDNCISIQAPINHQSSHKQNWVSNPDRQKEKSHHDEMSNSEISICTTSTLRRQSVRDLFDTYGIERPFGFASSEVVREEINKPERHRVCHICMWVHDKNETICWKCGHRLCKACDRLLTFSNGGKDATVDHEPGTYTNQHEISKSMPYTTTPRPAKGQITKQPILRPLPKPIPISKKKVEPKQRRNAAEPIPPSYPKEGPSQDNSKSGPCLNSAPCGPLHSCPGIYEPENPQRLPPKLEHASQANPLHAVAESFCQYITNEQRSESQSPQIHDSRCESCHYTNHGSFTCRHSTSHSMTRSDDVVAMDGGYATKNINNENMYRSHSYPDSSKASQPSMKFHRLLNGSTHRPTQLSQESDTREIPRTIMRTDPLLNSSMQRATQPTYNLNRIGHEEVTQPSAFSYCVLNGESYQPVQPSYGSDNIDNSKLQDKFYPFLNESEHGAKRPKYGSDYVECRGYPRTGHGHCDRSPVSSGVLGDCQHCLDDCECSACQSTVHSVRCCTNEVHKPMIHLHRSPAKVSLNEAYISGHHKLEKKPYILSRSQTYDRSIIPKYDTVSEWLGSPDEPSLLQRLDTPKSTPIEFIHAAKESPSIAIKKASDSLFTAQTPLSWASSPTIPKALALLKKEAANKISTDASSKASVNPNRASSSDGTKDQSLATVRSSCRLPTNSSPGYFAFNPWRDKEAINFSRSYHYSKQMSKSPLQQVSRRSTDCEISDICGQSEWAGQRGKSSESLSRHGLKESEQEKVRKKVHQWEDRRSESRRGRDTANVNANDMVTPLSGGYFDAQMRWYSSGSGQDIGHGVQGIMGSIEEEEGEGGKIEDEEERHDCVWKRRVMDLDERSRVHGSVDEGVGIGGKGEVGGVKGVTVVVHMDSGENLVLRMNKGGELSWKGLERLLAIGGKE